MGRRVRLGRVFGVEVAVDWSWVFTLVLAAWTLVTIADHVLPMVSGGEATLLGGAAAIGLFASLAVHEIAHGLAARACGVPVERLTLFLFGGITDVERAPASPRSETIAALVAPLSNAILGGALILGAVSLSGTAGAIGVLVGWLGVANLAIAAFNLLPAFPLDGGRLVRAAIWRATGDVERATRWSAWLGQMIGWSIVLGGVLLVFVSHGIGVAGAMWVAFVGWFLASAAAQAYEGVIAQEALAGVTVSRLMRRTVQAVPADVTLATAARAWLQRSEDVLPVVDGERFVGLISMDRVRSVRADRWPSTLVGELAANERAGERDDEAERELARPSDDAASTLRTLVDRGADRAPVVDGDRVVGLVERADIERWIATRAGSPSLDGPRGALK